MDKRMRWFEAVADCEQRGEPYVLVTIVGVAGSVPREPSSKMVVTGEQTYDTIGGGHLEYLVTARAREQLAASRFETQLEHFPLGASLGQCCGGSVSVLLEGQRGSDARLVVFGAGHVARALMSIMGQLPWQVTWVDSRADSFPAELPANVRRYHTDDDLCRALLNADAACSVGLIGSQTKADRFRQRLSHRGYSEAQIDGIRCPVGRSDVPGKRPMEVAVSISAELLSLAADEAPRSRRRGVSWPALRDLMKQGEAVAATEPCAENTTPPVEAK